tara:strand:- start:1699 stop:1962 length:264 start_codon:yes stop_codon:yes gene_type:complete
MFEEGECAHLIVEWKGWTQVSEFPWQEKLQSFEGKTPVMITEIEMSFHGNKLYHFLALNPDFFVRHQNKCRLENNQGICLEERLRKI